MLKGDIVVKQPYSLILMIVGLVSTILYLSSNIPLIIRWVLAFLLLLFILYQLGKKIIISERGIEVFKGFGLLGVTRVSIDSIYKVRFTKGSSASLPFSMKIFYNKSESLSFDIDSNKNNLIDLLLIFLKQEIKIEKGFNDRVEYFYNKALELNQAD